ncbi:hypothetical protein L6V77_03605 [Myxococcota bacterium]|nr:hypothetical protein [Myxococcota bacterium]
MTHPNQDNKHLGGEVFNEDCLSFLARYDGPALDLVYLDPPYFLERQFSLEAASSRVSFQGDWEHQQIESYCEKIAASTGGDSLVRYLSFLYPRLAMIRKRMSERGSLFLHIGQREGPYVRMLLDNIFGLKHWRSTITWQRSHPHNNLTRALGNISDFIYYYTASDDFTFNLLHTPHDEVYLSNCFSNSDERGQYALAPIIQERSRKGHHYEYNGVTPPHGWRLRRETLEAYDKEGRVHWGKNRAYKKVYLHEAKGAALQNIWTDIYNITRTEVDRRKYPTQKPEKLLSRIVELSSKPGDLVYDPFCGSGTTLVSAKQLGRRVLGTDISAAAVEITTDRLGAITQAKAGSLF